MNWYLSKLVYRIVCGDGNHAAQFDEQLRLIAADNRDEAIHKAQAIGKNEQETFVNDRQQLVKWEFVNISELYLLSELIDGAELYSRIEEKENADAYIYTIHQKAENLFFAQTSQLLKLA